MARGRKGTHEPELTRKQLEQMALWIRMGLTVTEVCKLSVISRDTFYTWVKEGKKRTDTEDPVRKFSDAVHQGRLSAKAHALTAINLGMMKDWKAAAWYLGVTYPKDFGAKIRVTLDAEYTAALARMKATLPPEMYELALRAITGGEGDAGAEIPGAGEVFSPGD